jgi:hypothetical protein
MPSLMNDLTTVKSDFENDQVKLESNARKVFAENTEFSSTGSSHLTTNLTKSSMINSTKSTSVNNDEFISEEVLELFYS